MAKILADVEHLKSYLPDLRKEYDGVREAPHLIPDPDGNYFYQFLTGIIEKLKQLMEGATFIDISSADREMILHFSDLISKEMKRRAMLPTLEKMKVIARAADPFPDLSERLKRSGELFELAKKVNAETHDRQMLSLEGYLRTHGYIIPADQKEFADWFFLVKCDESATFEDLAKLADVGPEYLREFHEWKERRFKGEPDGKHAPKVEPPAFADLFVSAEAMEKALQAARAVGILNDANHWEYGGKVGAIVIFWEFLRGQNEIVRPEQINNPLAIDSIAAFWGQTISDRTKRNAPEYRSELLRDLKAAIK